MPTREVLPAFRNEEWQKTTPFRKFVNHVRYDILHIKDYPHTSWWRLIKILLVK